MQAYQCVLGGEGLLQRKRKHNGMKVSLRRPLPWAGWWESPVILFHSLLLQGPGTLWKPDPWDLICLI